MADGSVTIEVNGDASELIAAFRQAAAAADALSGNISGIADAFQSVTAAANQINGGGMDEAANSAQNLGDTVNDIDEYIDELDAAFDEMRNDPFNTQADGADELREDLDRLGDAADDAEEDLDDLGDASDDLSDNLDEAGGSASKFGEIFKGTFLGNLAAKGVELATEAVKKLGETLIDVGKQAVESYASYEQLVGGMDTLFKESSGTMQKYASEAYKTAGMSANEYMQTATSFAATLITSVGGDTAKAAEQANKAIIQMSDNANKMGTNLEDIQNAYKGFAKENWTMLDNLSLGYSGTKEGMQQLLEDATALSGVKYDISSYSDIIDAIGVIQDQWEITGTTAKEASQTIEGSVGSMKKAWANWLTGLANPDADMGTLTQKLVESIQTALSNVIPAIQNILGNLGSMISEGLSNLFPNVGEWVSGPIESLKSAFSGVAEAFNKVFTPERREAIASFFQTLGEITATVAITALSGALEFLANIINAVITVIGGLITFFSSTLPAAIQAVITWFQNLPTNITNALTAAGNAIRNWASSAKDALVTGVSNAINAVITWFSGLATKITAGLTAAGNAIRTWGNNVKTTMVNAVTNAINAVVTWFSNLATKITGALTAAGAAIRNWASTTVTNMKTAATNAVNAVVTFFTSLPGKITSALSGALSALISWGSQMAAQARAKMVQVGNNIKSALASLPSQLVSIGANIIQGLLNGITSKVSAVIAKIKSIASSIKGAFASALDIHSPSRVFNEFGIYIVEGLVNGISSSEKLAKRAVVDLANVVTKGVEDLNKQVEKIETEANERSAAKELAEYKKNLTEKNEELAKAEKKDRQKIQEEIDKLNSDWNEKQLEKQEAAQKEALKSQISTLEELKSNYEKAISDVESSRDSLGSKLGDVDLYEEDEEDGYFQLTNLQKSIDAINQYGDTIQALKDRGIADSLLDEVLGLDQEKAIKYANALLKMGDEQYDNYMNLWQQKEDAAKKVAQSIYQEEIDAIKTEYLDKLPDEFKPAGEDAMEAFRYGLVSSGELAIEDAANIADQIIDELDRIKAAQRMGEAVNSNIDSTSTRLSSSVKSASDGKNALKSEDLTSIVSAMMAVANTQGRDKEIVLTLNGKEIARGLIDDIRAVEDQSPRIVSD